MSERAGTRRSTPYRRCAAQAAVALLVCLALGAAAAAAQPPTKPSADELWSEFPLDPGRGGRKTTTETPSAPTSAGGTGEQAASQSERPESRAPGSDSGVSPVPFPVLLALAIAATLLLWYLAVGQHASVARSRLRALLSIGRRKLAVVNHGEPEVPTGVALVHRFVGDADASREEPPAPVSVAAAPTADADESDELGWLEAEVERARQAHDVVSLLLVQAASAAAAAREEVAADAVASAVDDAFHDVPRKLRRDGETVSVILPHTLAEGARHRAARVALFLPNESWALSIAASLRTAVACFPRDAATAEELLRICQQALRD